MRDQGAERGCEAYHIAVDEGGGRRPPRLHCSNSKAVGGAGEEERYAAAVLASVRQCVWLVYGGDGPGPQTVVRQEMGLPPWD